MSSPADFETLELLFRRAGSLPALPETAVKLVKSIDSGAASAADLERIIAADPNLTAEFLRMASLAAFGGVPRYSTIRGAIMLLGQRTVRALAMSLLLRQMTSVKSLTPYFDAARFSRHSLAVGLIARFLFARKQPPNSGWNQDEVFAVGLLSSLGIGLLMKVSTESFDRVYFYAKRAGTTLEAAFQKLFGKPSTLLTAAAVEVWQLPAVFSDALIHIDEPWGYPEEFAALCCLNYAVALSDVSQLSIGNWPVEFEVLPDVEAEVNLSEEERNSLSEAIKRHVEDWVHPGRAAA